MQLIEIDGSYQNTHKKDSQTNAWNHSRNCRRKVCQVCAHDGWNANQIKIKKLHRLTL